MGFKVKRKDNVIQECLVTGLRQALKDDTTYHACAFEEAWFKAVAKVTQFLEQSLGEESWQGAAADEVLWQEPDPDIPAFSPPEELENMATSRT